MELQRLSGLDIGGQNEAAVQAFANQIGAIIVVKSHQLAQDVYVVLPTQIISEIPKWMKRHEEEA